ncbi:MAG: aminomethyl-transferring glycine dehydrogenase subunit GcvPB, partial [Candidatus Latescibacteria bacterium]|nr:aminomethyl-transferring glycine dehydrogenase subunit GcvPB [Candidatus Latescibacterota bacterium]
MDRDLLIFERSASGRRCTTFPKAGESRTAIPEGMRRETPPALPEVGELDLVRHYTALSRMNFSIDTEFYPLGSCTMKYNPRVHEKAVRVPEIAGLHPMAENAQPALEVVWEMEQIL